MKPDRTLRNVATVEGASCEPTSTFNERARDAMPSARQGATFRRDAIPSAEGSFQPTRASVFNEQSRDATFEPTIATVFDEFTREVSP